ncbi:MAG: hypothetical protein RL662_398 [Bacteroidota bacterium]|jgi:pantoate--beta-alanine ligase
MITLRTVSDIQTTLSSFRAIGKTIGFVPTMGALHDGHLSLVKESSTQNDLTVVSIFVNPTQFNNKEDLEKYPRTLDKDLALLQMANTDIVFAPSVSEIYPDIDNRIFDFGLLDKVMEGKFRQGHFNGVAQVVSRLFDIVQPNKAYFGEKDFQQLAIIRDMVYQHQIPTQIVGMPIRREYSGLAMSSRNQRLTDSQRNIAATIYAALAESKRFVNKASIADTVNYVVDTVNKSELLKVEYFEIVDGNTLQTITEWADTNYAVGCIAAFCGDIRLIDNITYFNNEQE